MSVKHRMPKRVPTGVLSNGKTPLLTVDQKPGVPTALYEKVIGNDPGAREADRYFLSQLIRLYRLSPFQRGDLDTGRINRLLGRELKLVEGRYAAQALGAYLRIDEMVVRSSFPGLLEETAK